jgi:F-box/TPR repeat protein Pof3
MILEYLTFRHMVNCMRVSKGWRDYIANLHRLWMHLDLSGARRPVSRKFVDKAVRRSENRLTRLTIHRFEHVDVLKNVAKVCRDLTELEFISLPHTMASTLIDIVACAPKLEKFVVRPDITLDTASQILNTRPTLQHVGFPAVKPPRYSAAWKGPFPVLAAFHLHFTDAAIWTNLSLDTLLPLTPVLKTLDLGNVHYSPGWVENHLSNVPLTTLHLKLTQCRHPIPALPATLQRLSIESTGPAIQLSDETLYLQTSNLPALTHLSLINFSNLDPARLSEFLDPSEPEPAAPLTSLSLAGLFADTCPSLAQLLLSSPRILTPSLSHLHVATLPVTDDEIEALVARAPGLISVDVSRTNITGAGVKMLVDGCPGLKSVKADGCVRISGRDVVEWARRRGVWVSARMEEGRGGKKLRY